MKNLLTDSGYDVSVLSYDLNNHILVISHKNGQIMNINLNKNEIISLCSLIENSLNVQTLNAEIP